MFFIQSSPALIGCTEQHGWLHIYLKLYVRVFQHASDLSETVEEKLLVGDRPKRRDDDKRPPLNERLSAKNDDDDLKEVCYFLVLVQAEADPSQLTPEERLFAGYGTALADWLEPHHDHARPSAAVVLAEAAKLSSNKRTAELLSANGTANGHTKKDEQPPPILDPPEVVQQFFDSESTITIGYQEPGC